MNNGKAWKRIAAFLLALAVMFTNVAFQAETVQAASRRVKSVTLKIGSKKVTKKTVTMYSGDSKTLKVSVSPSKAKKKVEFRSDKKSVASVNGKGVITAKKSGKAKIKVTVTGKDRAKKSTYVNVKVKNVSLKLNKSSTVLQVGKSLQLKATVSPKRDVSWTTSNKQVASVTSSGSVRGRKAGTASITARVGNKKAVCKVTVRGSGAADGDDGGNVAPEVKVQGLSASIEGGDTIYVGHTKPVKTVIVPANATNKTLSYASSNTGVAQVNANGAILGISEGTAVITVTASSGVKASATVKVVEVPVESVEVSPGTLKLPITGTANLTATVLPKEAANKVIIWSSDDMAIATVDVNGKVTGVAEGKTEIKAQVKGSDRFGVCEVEVVSNSAIADGVSLEVTNPYKDNMGEEYPGTVLFGKDMAVRARVVRDGQPVGNTNVNLSIKPVFGNAPECFEVRSSNEKTDANGYANFYVGVKSEYPDLNAVSGKWQSFIVTAKDSASNETAEVTAKFATIQLDKIAVLNNSSNDYADIAPSTNASPADSGIYETVSTNGAKNEQYVTSQQVSSAGNDHKVYLEAQPYLLLPATKESEHSGDWLITYPDGEDSGVSGGCSIYNDVTNETTTTNVEEVPAGLNNLTVSFNKISLSKYTAIYLDLYNADTGASIDHKEITADNNGDNAGVQLGVQKDIRSYLVISLVSQGQVEADNEGYAIKEIKGGWTTASNQQAMSVPLKEAVEWQMVDSEYSEWKNLTNLAAYVPADMVAENYTYRYKVPVFPQAGNAVIEAKDPNNAVTEYFVHPSVNAKTSSGYANINSLAPVRKTMKAVYLGQEDVGRQKVGTLTTDGNMAVVDSTETGVTALKAVIHIDGLSSGELDSQNGGELYTAVQWVPVPQSPVLETVQEYYAIEGQSVTITAQVTDMNGNNVSGKKVIQFKYKYGDITKQGETLLNEDGDTTNNFVTVIASTDNTTDINGEAVLKLQGYNMAYVEGLTATCDGYKVKLTIGSNAKEEIRKANIYWVDLGLTYANSAVKDDSPQRITNFENRVGAITTESSSKVGKRWKVGFLPVARSHKFGYADPEKVERPVQANEFISVSNIPVTYSYSGEGNCTYSNSVATLYSEQTGTTSLTGKIKLPTDTSSVMFTFYDADGNEVSLPNIGDNGSSNSTENTGLNYQMHWNTSGETLQVLARDGTSLSIGKSTEVYLKLMDQYGNPISGKNITYTISGLNGQEESQTGTTDSYGRVTVSLPAPGEAGTTTVTATAEKDKNLQGSVAITYN